MALQLSSPSGKRQHSERAAQGHWATSAFPAEIADAPQRTPGPGYGSTGTALTSTCRRLPMGLFRMRVT